jgi:heterodisulfide reductase subunit A
VHRLWDKMERAGVRPERLQLEWISAAEGQKFAKVMHQMEELRQGVKPEEIDLSKQALKPKPKKPKKPKAKTVPEAAPAATD